MNILALALGLGVSVFTLSAHADEKEDAKRRMKPLTSRSQLNELWYEDQIYFVPARADRPSSWAGEVYRYVDRQCFEIIEVSLGGETLTGNPIPCKAKLKERAEAPYEKIEDFAKFQDRFTGCVLNRDQKCLRGLIARNLQISLGADPMTDRRDLIFKTWKPQDYVRLDSQLRKGVVGEDEVRSFPPAPVEGEWRGRFEKIAGGWRLTAFLAEN